MNRHLRNFLFFALAFTLTLMAGFASATGWTVNDGYDHSGGNLNRVPYGNPTAGTTATAVVNGDTVDVTRSWTQPLKDAVTGATATAAINVLSKAPAVGIVNAAKSLTLPGLAMTVATTWLLNQSWTRDASGNWLRPDTSQFAGLWNSVWYPNCKCAWSTITKGSYNYAYYNPGDPKMGYRVYYHTPNGDTSDVVTLFAAASNVPASDADLITQMNNLLNAKPADVLRDLAQQKIELQGVLNQIKQTAQALSAQKTTATGTKTNPDGSTEAYQMQEMIKFEIPEDLYKSDDPVPVKQSTVTTTTTNVYNIDNTVKTTTTTDIKNSNVTPAKDPQTDCDKKPNSIGCSDWGDAPSAPDLPTQDLSPSFSWSPFSISSYCPQPKSIVTHFGTYQLEYTPMCDLATGIKPLVLAFAFFGALFICFGARNDG